MKRLIIPVLIAALALPAAANAQIENKEAAQKYNDAVSLFRQGKYEESLALALESARLEPGNYRAHYLAGLVYKRNRKGDEALAQYEAALSAHPTYYQVMLAEGKVYEDLKNDPNKAIEWYLKSGEVAEQSGQKYPDAYKNAGALLMGQQRWDEASMAWGKVAEYEPSNEVALNALGMIYLQKGDYNTALTRFAQAQVAKPSWFEPYWHQADCMNKIGEYQQAVDMAEEALKRQPGHGGALLEKGLALKSLQKWDAALEALEAARKDGTWRAVAEYQIDLIKNRDKYVIPPITG